MNPEKHTIMHKFIKVLGLLMMNAAFALCFAAGYGLSVQIFRITGQPAGIFSHIVAGLLGLYIFILIISAAVAVINRFHRENGRRDKIRGAFLEKTIEAMERISHGDFGVLVPVEEHDPFSEIAESVNKMARELGSMESLRQDFISNVSHEIQSPLTSISGFAALLKNEALSPEQRAHYIDIIETEAGRLSKLSDNLLKLSALESNEQSLARTSFSLEKQIQDAVLILEPQWAAKNLAFSLNLEKITCRGDRELLTQVWINLLHNAIKFTPEGGEISITLTGMETEARCRISDTGVGFSEEDRVHLFERFYKADRSRDRSLGGNGLGLSLVKKIVELHGGKVSAESRPGAGSTFTVTLPLSPEK